MLRLTAGSRRLCNGTTRRGFLRVGGAAMAGLGLPELLRADGGSARRGRPRARNLIVFALEGGPAHQDLWDMKPDAPSGVRSAFRPTATGVPGLHVCEHLPRLARQAYHPTLVRSIHLTAGDHNAGYYYAMTDRPRAGPRRAADRGALARRLPEHRRGAGEVPPQRQVPAGFGPYARLDEQQRQVVTGFHH
jgi:hypothetical protein